MKKITKEQIIKRMVKGGCNKEEAIKKVEQQFDFVVRCYEGVTVREAANIIMTVAQL